MIQTIISNLFPTKEGISNSGSSEASPKQSGHNSEGECRGDGRVSFGYSLLRGKRSTMEDFHDAQFKHHQCGEEIGFFGVFDGHGGPDAANYVRLHLFNNMMQHPHFMTNIKKAVEESYVATDESYLQEQTTMRDDGCTAVTAVVRGRTLFVANVGDSRAVLCRGGRALQLSIDHKPNDLEEKQRIESLGGMVVWAGTWRVGGVLAVSRAFGDRPLKKKRYVVAEPSSFAEHLSSADEFLVLATDGVWDVITNEEAVGMIRDIRSPQKAAAHVTEMALNRGSNDNISCIVIRFKF